MTCRRYGWQNFVWYQPVLLPPSEDPARLERRLQVGVIDGDQERRQHTSENLLSPSNTVRLACIFASGDLTAVNI